MKHRYYWHDINKMMNDDLLYTIHTHTHTHTHMYIYISQQENEIIKEKKSEIQCLFFIY